jgi:hypothetical protein
VVSPLLVLWLVATPPTPASPAALAALAAGRFDEVERERLAAVARGVDVSEGAWAWLREASRLMRCLPLEPLPPPNTTRPSPRQFNVGSKRRRFVNGNRRRSGNGSSAPCWATRKAVELFRST